MCLSVPEIACLTSPVSNLTSNETLNCYMELRYCVGLYQDN